jgi:signal peptidase
MSHFARSCIFSLVAIVGGLIVSVVLLLLGSLWPGDFGYDIRIVESGSMEPTIPTGAIVLTRPETLYQVGDVVTYQRRTDQAATTHRLVDKVDDGSQQVFLTQGDANNVADVQPVLPEEIAGKVWFNVPYLGYVLSFFRSPWGFMLLVLIPAMLIVWEQLARIWQTVVEEKKKTKQ